MNLTLQRVTLTPLDVASASAQESGMVILETQSLTLL